MDGKSSRSYIREAWLARIETADSFDMPEVSAQIAEELLLIPEFCQRFTADFVVDTVLAVGEHMMRTVNRQLRQVGSVRATPDAIRADVQHEIESKWERWMEFDPVAKAKITLLKMTKPMLLAAADARKTRGVTEIREAEWLRLLAGRLKGNKQTVGDVWKDGEIDDLRARLNVRIETGLDGLTTPTATAAD